MTLNEWYANLNRHLDERQQSEAEFARIAGITIEEYDADTTALDPGGDDE